MDEEEGKSVALWREGGRGPGMVVTVVEEVLRGDWDQVIQEEAGEV